MYYPMTIIGGHNRWYL